MDLDLFYPREVERTSHPTILAMARPGKPWRGYDTLISALHQVKLAMPTVKIILFGDSQLFKQAIPFDYTDKGIVFQQNQLANLYSQVDIFVDTSDYQGFGRPALEAMACGTACVLTNEVRETRTIVYWYRQRRTSLLPDLRPLHTKVSNECSA